MTDVQRDLGRRRGAKVRVEGDQALDLVERPSGIARELLEIFAGSQPSRDWIRLSAGISEGPENFPALASTPGIRRARMSTGWSVNSVMRERCRSRSLPPRWSLPKPRGAIAPPARRRT